MHHSSAINSVDGCKCRECEKNILLDGISLTDGVSMLHNCGFIFEPKSTRNELIECNIDSSDFRS